mgnify:CR=1
QDAFAERLTDLKSCFSINKLRSTPRISSRISARGNPDADDEDRTRLRRGGSGIDFRHSLTRVSANDRSVLATRGSWLRTLVVQDYIATEHTTNSMLLTQFPRFHSSAQQKFSQQQDRISTLIRFLETLKHSLQRIFELTNQRLVCIFEIGFAPIQLCLNFR